MKPMYSLLLKDYYSLKRAIRFLLVITALFQLMPGTGMFLGLFYALLLPNSAFAYDDRNRWGEMAAVMPYSVRDIVWSRYLLAWAGVPLFQVTGFLARCVFAAIGIGSVNSGIPGMDGIGGMVLLIGFSMLILAVTLPIYFRFDAEKSQLIRTFMLMVLCGFSSAAVGAAVVIVGGRHAQGMEARLPLAFCGGVWAAAVVLTAVSIPLSMAAYRARRK